MNIRLLFSFALAAAALVSASCKSNSRGLYSVHGKVHHKGQPAVGATVYFHRQGVNDRLHQVALQGTVQKDGSFELAGPAGTGAPPGEYVVLVEWKKGAGEVPGRAPRLTAPDRFAGRYMHLDKPAFHAEVKAATTQLPPFELE
jgi:hypothetical protein